MSKYNRGGSRNNYRKSYNNYGSERARQHIREAEALTKELGGTDKDVKEYFFSLDAQELEPILTEYGYKYGEDAKEYAEKTITKWSSGQVNMSGMVAERLFNLLPPYMPLSVKYKLIENLWTHVGVSSKKVFYIGLDADVSEVERVVKEYLEGVASVYQIPASMEKRFNWLSQGDANIKQQLLNFFQQKEKDLVSDVMATNLPILISHIANAKNDFSTNASQVLNVGKHEVLIKIDKNINGVTDIAPVIKHPESNNIIWWIIGFIILAVILSK